MYNGTSDAQFFADLCWLTFKPDYSEYSVISTYSFKIPPYFPAQSSSHPPSILSELYGLLCPTVDGIRNTNTQLSEHPSSRPLIFFYDSMIFNEVCRT